MKKKVTTVTVSVVLFALFLFFYTGCTEKTVADSSDTQLPLAEFEEVSDGDWKASSSLVEEDEKIAEYKAEMNEADKEVTKAVNKIVSKVSRKRQLYRRLGDRFLELGWYKEAYKNYQLSLEVKNDAETIHFKSAVAAASYVKQIAPLEDPVLTLSRAEYHYKKALEIRPDYKEALVGLAVLYHFEWKRHIEALELTTLAIEVRGRATPRSLMLRGNIYRFFRAYRQKTGVDYPGAASILMKINNERQLAGLQPGGWSSLAAEDYQRLIDTFGKVSHPEFIEQVESARAMIRGLSGEPSAN